MEPSKRNNIFQNDTGLSIVKAIQVAEDQLMVTGDIMLESCPAELFDNASINPEIQDQPTNVPPDTHTRTGGFTLLCLKFLFWVCDMSNSLHNWILRFVYVDSNYRINDYLEYIEKKKLMKKQASIKNIYE